MKTPVSFVYIPTALAALLVLFMPQLDMLVYLCGLICFAMSLLLAVSSMYQPNVLPAVLGGVALPAAALYQVFTLSFQHQDLPLVLAISVGISIPTLLSARAEGDTMSPVSLLIPFFNAACISAVLRTPHGFSLAQIAVVAAVVLLSAMLASLVFPLPRAASKSPDDTL